MIRKLISLLTRKDKLFLFYLFIFSIFISLMETISISIIMPFISVASDFNLIESNHYINWFYTLFEFKNHIDFVVFFGVFLIIFYLLRSGINLYYFYMLAKFSKGSYHILAYRLFENYLGMSYRNFIDKNSSEIYKALIIEAQNLTLLISAMLLIVSESFVIIFIYSIMLYVNWKITLLLSIFLGVNAILLLKTISPKIKHSSFEREKFQKSFFSLINSTLGNFKIMKLKSNTNEIMSKFETASHGYTKINIFNETVSQVPRLFLEGMGFSLVAFMVIFLILKYQSDISHAIALLSMFILGLYRLMPSVNRILTGYNQILFSRKSLDIIHTDIMYDSENLEDASINFADEIVLENIYFEFNKDKVIINDANLTIQKGSSIAFIGESGSGKSTLVDLIIGLYRPLKGKIKVDGQELNESNIKSWRKKIGYIPQTIYLFDGTVAQNVAFGNMSIDEQTVKDVLQKANILEFLESHQNGIHTIVGENGIMLSGGQKQRIAIARALYDDPEILVLDEATSALDDETEKRIMDEIYKICTEKTLIIIAHRLSTLSECKQIYKIEHGKIHYYKKSES